MKQNQENYSIEFAHIYINETHSREHFDAAWIAKQKAKELDKKGCSYSLNILIDDYNPSESILDVSNFINKIQENVEVDHVASEAALVMWTKLLLEEISKSRIRKSNLHYINRNHKVPCSFLVAVWNLIRLNELTNEIDVSIYKDSAKSLVGERIINILPSRYEEVEKRALDIIEHTRYKECINRIEHIFY